jgi:hypothetical protein
MEDSSIVGSLHQEYPNFSSIASSWENESQLVNDEQHITLLLRDVHHPRFYLKQSNISRRGNVTHQEKELKRLDVIVKNQLNQKLKNNRHARKMLLDFTDRRPRNVM